MWLSGSFSNPCDSARLHPWALEGVFPVCGANGPAGSGAPGLGLRATGKGALGAESSIAVINVTRSTVLATRVTVATSHVARARGLLGMTSLPHDKGLILRPCKGVHSFGMKFAIDVAYVSRAGTVLRIVAPLAPGKAGPIVWRAAWVLEVPEGVLAETGTVAGDRLLPFYHR